MTAIASKIGKVIAVGEAARGSLAIELAGQFQHNAAQFDPRSLERLGAAGLQTFLDTVRAEFAPVAKRPRQHQPVRQPAAIASSGTGWLGLRRPETPIWIGGVVAGIRAGAIVTAFGLPVLLLAERIIPFAWSILS